MRTDLNIEGAGGGLKGVGLSTHVDLSLENINLEKPSGDL